jgi:hypothetical protein
MSPATIFAQLFSGPESLQKYRYFRGIKSGDLPDPDQLFSGSGMFYCSCKGFISLSNFDPFQCA